MGRAPLTTWKDASAAPLQLVPLNGVWLQSLCNQQPPPSYRRLAMPAANGPQQPPVVFLFSEGLPELVGCSEVWDGAWPSEVQGGPRRPQPFLEGIAEHLSDSI